ncbi:MAG: hypothetical protein Q4A76_09015 [Porphyromonadaceae bacterium]|nr:hypothetical protein [Porphyromonadaceae bacterium]
MKEHFKEYNELGERIEELEAKLQDINIDLYNIGSVAFDRIPSEPSQRDITLVKISEKQDLEKEIYKLKTRKNDLYIMHLNEIALVDCNVYRRILRCWYLLNMPIPQIESATGYRRSQIYKLKKEADEEFGKVVINIGQERTTSD